MEKHKKVFLEPKDPSKYQATMDSFYKAIFKSKD
jgi:regulator of telomere elongation helicase 1